MQEKERRRKELQSKGLVDKDITDGDGDRDVMENSSPNSSGSGWNSLARRMTVKTIMQTISFVSLENVIASGHGKGDRPKCSMVI